MTPYLLGLAICSRPPFLLAFPLIAKLIGRNAATKAGGVAFVLTLATIYLGWGGHMVSPKYARETAGLMFLLSCGFAALLKDRRDLWLALAAVVVMPGLYVSNAAYHVLFGLPFLVMAICDA